MLSSSTTNNHSTVISPLHPTPLPHTPFKPANLPPLPLKSYNCALATQPTHPTLLAPLVKYASIPLFLTGTTLVLTSMYALGLTGTYLGDYFGILMPEPVTSFPFTVSAAPMYHGSTLSFLATALWHGKPAGLLLTALVTAAYGVARAWEDPFTGMIYAERDEQQRKEKKKKKKQGAKAL